MGWVDSHVHVWSIDDPDYPLAPGIEPAGFQPPDFGPTRLLDLAATHQVTRIVLIQPSCYGEDHRFMLAARRNHPGRFAAVGRIAPDHPDLADRLDDLAAQGVRGVRLGLGRRTGWADDPAIDTFFAACAERRLAVCPLLDPPALPDLTRVVARHPETVVVIDHIARLGAAGTIAEAEVDDLLALAEPARVYLKFSAWYAQGTSGPPYGELVPVLERLLAAFGCGRVMWGSDAPHEVTRGDYGASLALVRDRLGLSPDERERVLRGTAEEVFWDGS